MSGHGAFNAYLFRMKLVDSPDCSNCDRRGLDDDACTPFLSVRHFNCTRRTKCPPYKRWVNSFLHQTIWSRLCWKMQEMGPSGRCCFDNVPQDGEAQGWQIPLPKIANNWSDEYQKREGCTKLIRRILEKERVYKTVARLYEIVQIVYKIVASCFFPKSTMQKSSSYIRKTSIRIL